jgi:hypothetical protein
MGRGDTEFNASAHSTRITRSHTEDATNPTTTLLSQNGKSDPTAYHLARHHRKKFGKVDGAVAVGIDLVDHVLELGLGRVLAEGAHDSAKLLGGDGSITVLVEKGEGLSCKQRAGYKRHQEYISEYISVGWGEGGSGMRWL